MSGMIAIAGAWLHDFLLFLPVFFPLWLGAWLICLALLIVDFQILRPRCKTRVAQFDRAVGQWASRLRYRGGHNAPGERILLTWFFRFWTNFASAPSLSVLAFAVPLWFVAGHGPDLAESFSIRTHWLLPLFCYFGSMGLSYVLKRVFKRSRPVRDKGAFGHRLKDGSFPSGHSLTAFCFWMPMIVSVFRDTQSAAVTGVFAVIAVLIVALTGLSRIYMVVHWPSDIVGGYLIGAVWTAIFLSMCAGAF